MTAREESVKRHRMVHPVIKGVAFSLFHAPNLVRYGFKPHHELSKAGEEHRQAFLQNLRTFEDAVSYPPNQVFIGNLSPRDLASIPRPWFRHPIKNASARSPFGEILPEELFLAFLRAFDDFDLFLLEASALGRFHERLAQHPLVSETMLARLANPRSAAAIKGKIEREAALPIALDGRLLGCVQRAHEEDESLTASVLLENLACKTSGVFAVRSLLAQKEIAKPDEIDYLLSTSEEAVGDRYNRGGGSMAKAIGELAGCSRATGADVKAFCAAPLHALIMAATLVQAGVFRNVIVVGGGSLPKLGMKYQSHIEAKTPILEDVLGAFAVLVGQDDSRSPVIRLDAVGKHDIVSGASQQAILEDLVVKPLHRIGLRLTDVDVYATEMHDPEVTAAADRGDVTRANYRMIAALASLQGDIEREEIDSFVTARGMPGFAPTQGHIPAAVPVLPHVLPQLKNGTMQRAMFLAKGSLFLGRMTHLSDGMSVLLERNPAL